MLLDIQRGIRRFRTLLSADARPHAAPADSANDWQRVASLKALQSRGEAPVWKSRGAQPDWDGEADVEWNLLAFPGRGAASDGA